MRYIARYYWMLNCSKSIEFQVTGYLVSGTLFVCWAWNYLLFWSEWELNGLPLSNKEIIKIEKIQGNIYIKMAKIPNLLNTPFSYLSGQQHWGVEGAMESKVSIDSFKRYWWPQNLKIWLDERQTWPGPTKVAVSHATFP